MRKLLSLALSLLVTASLIAQTPIVINSTDMPVVGDTLHAMRDTMPVGFLVGNAGVNQLWNFSNLNGHEPVTTYVVDPNSTPDGNNFPNANIALTNDFISYLYSKLNAQAYTVEGFAGDVGIGVQTSVEFSNTYDQYRFTIDYQDNYTDDYAFTEIIPFSSLPPDLQAAIQNQIPIPGITVTRVRLRFSATFTHTVDGWGTAVTPIGSYECLRQKRVEDSETRIDVETEDFFGNTMWNNNITVIPANTTDYQWLTKVTKQPLIALGYDTSRNIISATYSLTPPPAPPLAVDDSATVMVLDSVVVDLLANDTDPDGDSIFVQNITNALNGTIVNFNNGTILYKPNSCTSGTDMFSYVICDNGVPQLCDTATVYIEIQPLSNPPIAQFTYTNPPGGLVIFSNTSQNSNSYAWDFDDGSPISNDASSSINHVYSSNGDYNVCLTAFFRGCSDTFCDTVTVIEVGVNHPPIATDDSAAVIAPDTLLLTPLANDIDPDGDNLFLGIVANPTNGSTTKFGNGTIEYKPNAGSSGQDMFFYTVCDDGTPSLCDTGMVYIDVRSLPTVDFDYVVNGLSVTFTNRSVNFDSIHWDLGDGATSNLPSFTHTYAAKNQGAYQVCLTAVNGVGSKTECETITTVGIDNPAALQVKIYPNPVSETIYVEADLPGKARLTIFNTMGAKLKMKELDDKQKAISIDISDLPDGVYVLQVTDMSESILYKGRFITTSTSR